LASLDLKDSVKLETNFLNTAKSLMQDASLTPEKQAEVFEQMLSKEGLAAEIAKAAGNIFAYTKDDPKTPEERKINAQANSRKESEHQAEVKRQDSIKPSDKSLTTTATTKTPNAVSDSSSGLTRITDISKLPAGVNSNDYEVYSFNDYGKTSYALIAKPGRALQFRSIRDGKRENYILSNIYKEIKQLNGLN
jgi:HD superfamily phosphohydrolase